jgi:hypothetical protein
MKFFRLGSCLALLMAGAACTNAPQTPTAPSASVGGSTADAADGSTLKVTAPALVSPVDGARAEDRRPTIIWVNSAGRYGTVGVAYDIEVSTPTTVVYSMTVGETPDIGSHLLPFDLDYDTVYSWRVRAHLGDTLGPWSSWASFLSPTRPIAAAPVPGSTVSPVGGCAAPLSPMGPGETRKPRPNDSAIVRAVASANPGALRNSCQDHGGSWEFMDRVIDALRAKDGRYGYNCKRGNCNDPSQDVVSYYYGGAFPDIQGRFEVYIFDVIGGHCGSDPSTVWGDVTDITFNSGTVGRTMYPRPGRNVAPCAAAAASPAQ